MFRLLIFSLILILNYSCGIASAEKGSETAPTGTDSLRSSQPEIDGVYEFVSESKTTTLPEKTVEIRNNSAWTGFWFFQRGYFSRMVVKNERPEWSPARFPSNARGTGFDGVSGTYSVNGERLVMKYLVTYYPSMAYDIENVTYKTEGDKLTLTGKFTPTRESMAEVEVVTTLRKVGPVDN